MDQIKKRNGVANRFAGEKDGLNLRCNPVACNSRGFEGQPSGHDGTNANVDPPI